MNDKIKLTAYSKSAGCGCKIAPQVLSEILRNLPKVGSEKLLTSHAGNEDAAVYEMEGGNCLISTTDFFMPIVDDAFDFGKIAAANALSDVYAMGGKPFLAIATLGWPVEKIPAAEARKMLLGAIEICNSVSVPLGGGHSIDSPEPFFGLAVSGYVRKENIKRNNTAVVGDRIYLTKPLGTGILTTAYKRGLVSESTYQNLLESMIQLNSFGSFCGEKEGVHAMTDVTGFGLLGHLWEMLEGQSLTAILDLSSIPFLPEVESFASQMVYPDNTTRNYQSVMNKVKWKSGMEFLTLCDPQTSGGLLIAVAEQDALFFEEEAKARGQALFQIGKFVESLNFPIVIQ